MPINETAVWRRWLPSAVLSFIALEESEKAKCKNTRNTHRKEQHKALLVDYT